MRRKSRYGRIPILFQRSVNTFRQLRHTYLRVLHPLLTKTQLRNIPYKRSQLVYALESLLGNSRIRDVNPTTKRLVERCLSGDWCLQFRKSRDNDPGRASPTSESSSTLSPTVGETVITAASVHLQRTPSAKAKALKLSRSVENLTGRIDHTLRIPADDIPRMSNGSVASLPSGAAAAAIPPVPPLPPSGWKGLNGNTEAINGSHRHQYSDPETIPHTQQLLVLHQSPPSPHPPISPALSEGAVGKLKIRRPPPPAPKKRRQPPAVPSHGNGPVIMTTIRTSPLAKTAVGLRSSVS